MPLVDTISDYIVLASDENQRLEASMLLLLWLVWNLSNYLSSSIVEKLASINLLTMLLLRCDVISTSVKLSNIVSNCFIFLIATNEVSYHNTYRYCCIAQCQTVGLLALAT